MLHLDNPYLPHIVHSSASATSTDNLISKGFAGAASRETFAGLTNDMWVEFMELMD
jgi:hypothetical protein